MKRTLTTKHLRLTLENTAFLRSPYNRSGNCQENSYKKMEMKRVRCKARSGDRHEWVFADRCHNYGLITLLLDERCIHPCWTASGNPNQIPGPVAHIRTRLIYSFEEGTGSIR